MTLLRTPSGHSRPSSLAVIFLHDASGPVIQRPVLDSGGSSLSSLDQLLLAWKPLQAIHPRLRAPSELSPSPDGLPGGMYTSGMLYSSAVLHV